MKLLNLQAVLAIIAILFITNLTQAKEDDGLFTIQFSWNTESYGKNNTVKIVYQKKAFLSKAKSASAAGQFIASKNQFIKLQLSPGEYEFKAIQMFGKEFGYGKYLSIPIQESFMVEAGKVTNGGLIFLTRETKESMAVMTLKMDNTSDVEHHIKYYEPTFYGTDRIQKAWPYINSETINAIVNQYAEVLIKRENTKDREITYMYTTLGVVFKLQRDDNNKVVNYELIPTPTYQEIKKMKILDQKLLCYLSNGTFLYGDDNGLEYMPMPTGMSEHPELHIHKGHFILITSDFGMHWANNSFNWESQTDYQQSKTEMGKFFTQASYANFYIGKKHYYVFSKASGKQKLLLQSPHDNIRFTPVPLSKEVKEVPMVTETSDKIIIGPILKLSATAKRPAYLYVRDLEGGDWQVRNLPRGDCNGFSPGKDESVFYTRCNKELWFESKDFGASWEAWTGTD